VRDGQLLVAGPDPDDGVRVTRNPGDHLDPQALGQGIELPVETSAQEDLDALVLEFGQASMPVRGSERDDLDSGDLAGRDLSDEELLREPEPRRHDLPEERYGDFHRSSWIRHQQGECRIPGLPSSH